MTEAQALDFYRKAKGVGPNIITMTDPRDYREWMATALAVIVHLGDRLADLSSLALRQEEVQTELETQLRSYVQRTLEAPVPDETPEEVTGVAWQGTSADYFDNFAEINHDLAQNIAQAARAATKREEAMKLHPAAINVDSRPSEDPETA